MLKIALEPEAASIYCQFLPIERNPDGFGMTKEGTRYMIVDIGGMLIPTWYSMYLTSKLI
jgi:hypothetical protein